MSEKEIEIMNTSIENIYFNNKIVIELKNSNEHFFMINGKRKTFNILTYGCQMNEHDSEKISGILNSIGYVETEDETNADFVIFNTCLIRENAELKFYGKLGEIKGLKRSNPDMLVAICGCMMQRPEVREKIKKSFSFVDIMFGTNTIHELPDLIYNVEFNKRKSIGIIDNTEFIFEDMPKTRQYKYKALVNITYGCNNFCSYCVVPYVRGREKSRKPQDIINEVKELAKNGCKEITLLGQNVNSYGNSFESEYTFANLLRELNKINGIERIRFMTSHPKDLTDDLIYVIRDCNKICNHIHLPIQSGSNKILDKMNRKYTKEHYIDIVSKIKSQIPDVSITTDIIVGFPGETEEDFQETMDIVRKLEYDYAFTYLYSIREGTKAALMKDQIPEEIKHNRFNELLDVLYPIVYEKNKQCIGKVYSILVESVSKNSEVFLTGRTECFKLVHFKGSEDLIGQIVNVKITSVKTFHMEGVLEQ